MKCFDGVVDAWQVVERAGLDGEALVREFDSFDGADEFLSWYTDEEIESRRLDILRNWSTEW